MKSFKFDVSEVQTVVRERYEMIEKSLSEFKESIKLKYDLISIEAKKIDGFFRSL